VRILGKICPNFQKVAKTSFQAKKPKSKFVLKVQIGYIKALFKPQNTYNKPCFETAQLGENVKKIDQAKHSQKVAISFGSIIFPKIKTSFQM
jgi:hypothetical protein